jgi:uncharacterized delta-60 repeat protein
MKNLFLSFFTFFTLLAFSQDGSPDITFGDNGVVLTEFGESELVISSVSQGVTGRIAVLSLEYPVLAITNYIIQVYNEDGTVDTSFGDNGIVRYDNIIGVLLHKIHVLADNSILYGYSGRVFKLLPNGDVNTTFGDNGSIGIALSSTDSWGHVVHPNGSIYLYGNKLTGDKEFIINKFDSNGVVDTNFGNQGFVFIDFDFFPVFTDNNILFIENDALLVNYSAGGTANGGLTNYVIKIDASGEIDTSFGINGYVESYFNGLRNSNIHILNSGGFFISYAADDNGAYLRRIEAYLPNGTLDTSFAGSGMLSGHSVSFVQQNQRLMTREDVPDMNGHFLPELSRIYQDGNLDSTFNFQFNYTALSTLSTSQTADGKIIMAGANNDIPESKLVVLRYNNTPLSVEEHPLKNLIIAPNPSTAIFNINCSQCDLSNQPYIVVDMLGKVVKEGTFAGSNYTVDLTSYRSGVYLLKIGQTTLKLVIN